MEGQPADIPARKDLPLSWSVAGLALLLLLHGIVHGWWVARDRMQQGWDQPGYLEISLDYSRILARPGTNTIARLYEYRTARPPLFTALTAKTNRRTHLNLAAAAKWVNFFFFVLTVGVTFDVARRLAGHRAALLSAVIVSLCPAMYGLTRDVVTDVALVALCSLTFWTLIVARPFRNLAGAVLLGVALGLGALSKVLFIAMVALPLAVEAGAALVSIFRNRQCVTPVSLRTRFAQAGMWLLCLSVVVLIPYLIAWPWYELNRQAVTEHVQLGLTQGQIRGGAGGWRALSFDSIMRVVRAMTNYQLNLPLFIVVVGTCIFFFVARRRQWNAIVPRLLMVWISGVLILALIDPLKDSRYSMPWLPALAIVSATVLLNLRRQRARAWLIGSVLAVAFAQFVTLTLPGPLSKGIAIPLPGGWLPIVRTADEHMGPPRTEDWKVEQIWKLITGYATKSERQRDISVGLICSDFHMNSYLYRYVGRVTGAFAHVRVADLRTGALNDVMRHNFVVTREDFVYPDDPLTRALPFDCLEQFNADCENPASEFCKRFSAIDRLDLPDGSRATVWRRDL